MKTKTKMIFSAALAAALIALPRAHAATGVRTPPNARRRRRSRHQQQSR